MESKFNKLIDAEFARIIFTRPEPKYRIGDFVTYIDYSDNNKPVLSAEILDIGWAYKYFFGYYYKINYSEWIPGSWIKGLTVNG